MALSPQNDEEWFACQHTLAAMRRGDVSSTNPQWLYPSMTDTELMAHLGFHSDREQNLILVFMHERGFDTLRGLLGTALRHYHAAHHPAPDWTGPVGCSDLSDDEPLGCGHVGFMSVHLSADGKSQCTACANTMRGF